MLKDVLARIGGFGYVSKSLIARELQISESMVEEAIAQLLRMGYMSVEEEGATCNASCKGCAFANFCHKDVVKMYQLTDRGRALLAS